jgi:uncharacterized membrane protein YfcA
MFAKDLSNKMFLPPRRQDAKFNYNKHLFLCLGAFVAILSGLSGLGFSVQHLLFLTPDTRHLTPGTLHLSVPYNMVSEKTR